MATATRRPIDQLTPRQRDVIRMIAAGRTNGEIATALGVTIDGAKWHVSEILSKLGVSTREEAAQAWRSETTARAHVRRAMSALWPASFALRRALLGGAALAGAAGVAVGIALAVGGGGGGEPAAGAVAATATPPRVQEVLTIVTPGTNQVVTTAIPVSTPTVRPTSTLIPGWDFLDSTDGTKLALEPASGSCGTPFVASLSGFGANENVGLRLSRGLDDAVVVATGSTVSNGTASLPAAVPTDDCIPGRRFLYAAYRVDNSSAGGPRAIFQVDQIGEFAASLVDSDCGRVRVTASGLPPGIELDLAIGEADPFAHVFSEIGKLEIDSSGSGEAVFQPGSVCDWGEPAAVYGYEASGAVRATWRAIIAGTP